MSLFEAAKARFAAALATLHITDQGRLNRIFSKLPKRVGVIMAIAGIALFAEVAFSVSPKAEIEVVYGGPAEPAGADVAVEPIAQAVPGIFDDELLNEGPDQAAPLAQYLDGAASADRLFAAPSASATAYVIQPGDTLFSVAQAHHVDGKQLAKLNHGVTDPLIVGEQLTLPAPTPSETIAHVVWSGLLWPHAMIPVPGHIGDPHAFHDANATYQAYHGVDIPNVAGTPIRAADDGTVIEANTGWSGGYGNHVLILHPQVGAVTMYAHILDGGILVVAGEKVKRGDVIGYVGSTGHSTGPHLHFEVRKLNALVAE